MKRTPFLHEVHPRRLNGPLQTLEERYCTFPYCNHISFIALSRVPGLYFSYTIKVVASHTEDSMSLHMHLCGPYMRELSRSSLACATSTLPCAGETWKMYRNLPQTDDHRFSTQSQPQSQPFPAIFCISNDEHMSCPLFGKINLPS